MLSHISKSGKAVMVNIESKTFSLRKATAQSIIKVPSKIYDTIIYDINSNVLSTSRLAGICASKKTSELIPLCHQINLDSVKIDITSDKINEFIIKSQVIANYKTGVEMEALTAVTVASLTFYDMCKAISHDIIIDDIKLIKKSGGKSDINI
tara:strand:+ start:1182 stop:1637 length:456 start_codon:yes stop_codon:yes gene_type:complete